MALRTSRLSRLCAGRDQARAAAQPRLPNPLQRRHAQGGRQHRCALPYSACDCCSCYLCSSAVWPSLPGLHLLFQYQHCLHFARCRGALLTPTPTPCTHTASTTCARCPTRLRRLRCSRSPHALLFTLLHTPLALSHFLTFKIVFSLHFIMFLSSLSIHPLSVSAGSHCSERAARTLDARRCVEALPSR